MNCMGLEINKDEDANRIARQVTDNVNLLADALSRSYREAILIWLDHVPLYLRIDAICELRLLQLEFTHIYDAEKEISNLVLQITLPNPERYMPEMQARLKEVKDETEKRKI